MFLPYADSFYVDIATSAIDGACFSSDVTDQFLTMLAMENMNDYDGDGDFGTLTRIDLDDELRVVLTLLDGISSGDFPDTQETNLGCIASHYRQNEVMIGEGGTQKWWADFYAMTTDEADKAQAEFADAYSLYLGCEDCGHGYEGDPCICGFDPTIGPIPVGTVVSHSDYPGVAFRVDAYRPDGMVDTHMVGDDRTIVTEDIYLNPLADDAFCSECGQIGCGHGNV
jgi:hypothetical protein